MDMLSTGWMSSEQVSAAIAETERRYPSLADENRRIRLMVENEDVKRAIAADGLDVNAALVSSCRSDMLSCGRCALFGLIHKRGLMHIWKQLA